MDLEKFQDKIQREMSWRKKELSSIKFDIECSQNNKNSDIQEYRLKAGIVILYSHWEGAIKHFSECYLEYVSDLKLPYKELKPNFLSLSLKKEFKSFSESNKATLHNKLVRKVFSKQEEKSSIPKKDIINAKGNLNSDVFKEIMATIGLSTEEYESRYKYIDEKLLKNRNCIAHGGHFSRMSFSTIEEYVRIHEDIQLLIDKFAQDILKAAFDEEYRR